MFVDTQYLELYWTDFDNFFLKMRNKISRKNLFWIFSEDFLKIFNENFENFEKKFFFENFWDYTHMKEHSSETLNVQKFLIFDHPSSTYGSKRAWKTSFRR